MSVNSGTLTTNLLNFLERLEENRISYRLEHNRPESVTVVVAVPGEIWEVEFLRDGDVEVQKFVSDGRIEGEESLHSLFAVHGSDSN